MGTRDEHKKALLELKQTIAKWILVKKGVLKRKDLAVTNLPESQCDLLIEEYNRNPDNDLIGNYLKQQSVA